MAKSAIFVSLREFALANSRLPLMTRLIERGWRVIAATVPSERESLLGESGIELAPIPFRRGSFSPRDVESIRALREVYRSVSPSLVHHFNVKPFVYGGLAAFGLGRTRVVNTVTGLGHGFAHHRMARLGVGAGYRMTASRADAVIFQNIDDRDLFVNRGWIDPARARLIVSSGVDLARFPEPTHGADECDAVLMVTRLLWRKGVREFVEAARTLRRRGHEGPFVLGGEWEADHPDGVDPDYLAAAEHEGAIKFCGYIEDVPGALAEAGVLVAPSYYREGVSRVLLEAGVSRRPVIAADCAGAREVVRQNETGLLVPPADVGGLADAIEQLLQQPDRRAAMGQAAYHHVANRFSLRAVTDQQLQVYRDIGVLDAETYGYDTLEPGER